MTPAVADQSPTGNGSAGSLWEGTRVLVSGGAQGLGGATARRAAAMGAHVAVIDLDVDAASLLGAELGNRATVVVGDVTDEEVVHEAVGAGRAHGPLRLAAACAGRPSFPMRTVRRDGRPHDLDEFRELMDINVVGTFNVARLAAAEMSRCEPDEHGSRGVIVTTSSCAAFEGQTGQVGYATSKAAVVGMTLPMARDLAVMGIRVCCIAPGTFDTRLLQAAPDDMRDGLVSGTLHPHRMGDPTEFADLVIHIAANRYLNAEVIRLDAGIRLPAK